MRFATTRATALIAVLLIVLALPALAVNIVPTGVTAGVGGLTTKGGELSVETTAGTGLFTITKGTGAITATGTNAASAGFTLFKYAPTLGIMDGSDDFCVFDIDLTNANQTGTCTAEVLSIGNITGDAQCTETAIKVGTGWDEGLNVQSPSTLAFSTVVTETTAARTVTSADYGKLIVCTAAGGATTVTLPDPGAATVGATLYVAQTADQALNIVPTTANGNSIVADGVATSDKVSFETGSHKIGAMARIVGISATKWLITNASGCTMTIEAAD